MSPEQRHVFDTVVSGVMDREAHPNQPHQSFFLHSAGGCGKTWTSNLIAAELRSQGKMVITVAASGIAATLLDGGRTAHSMFKIPLQILNDSYCSIRRNSNLAKLIRKAALIIWDEVPMQDQKCIEAFNRSLQDIHRSEDPFPNTTFLFSGDYRQTLPVVPQGSREQIVAACFNKSPLWNNLQILHLTRNFRLQEVDGAADWAAYLLEIGCGRNTSSNGTIHIDPQMRCGSTIEELIAAIYPSIEAPQEDDYFVQRAILACRNDDVDSVNHDILSKFPGEEQIFYATDKVHEEGAEQGRDGCTIEELYPPEFLSSIRASGLPLSHLRLKLNAPVMLLRNIDATQGLCNGTRCHVVKMDPHGLHLHVIAGKFAGTQTIVPVMDLKPSDSKLPFTLSREQFPVRLCFAMTVNKSQGGIYSFPPYLLLSSTLGQSLANVGLDLRIPVFSHSQLYVALSRCTTKDNIKVLFPESQNVDSNTKTLNVVFPEVIRDLLAQVPQ